MGKGKGCHNGKAAPPPYIGFLKALAGCWYGCAEREGPGVREKFDRMEFANALVFFLKALCVYCYRPSERNGGRVRANCSDWEFAHGARFSRHAREFIVEKPVSIAEQARRVVTNPLPCSTAN
jgi:hypothetical protein